MAKSKAKKTMTREEALEYLTREEQRSRILAEVETDPAKKELAERRCREMQKKIQLIKKVSDAKAETADGGVVKRTDEPGKKIII